jgi:phosphoribosylglycinamide formyltransferase-1
MSVSWPHPAPKDGKPVRNKESAMRSPIKVGVLASGGGTNLQAIIDAAEAGRIAAQVVVVISDREGAGCLERARRHGIDAVHVPVPPTGTEGWEAANRRIVAELRSRKVELVAMAGYMRKVTAEFLRAFPGAVMNIHPALLPSFPGAHGQRDANEYGVKLSGATVHFADEEFDSGPIIIQAAVPALPEDTEETLAARILKVEHRIYPQAIQWFAEGRLRVQGRRVFLEGAPDPGDQCLIWPPLE